MYLQSSIFLSSPIDASLLEKSLKFCLDSQTQEIVLLMLPILREELQALTSPTGSKNFTEEEYFIPVGPGERVTFSYLLRPDAMLEPRTYGLLATVFYVDETGANFTTYFYNDTVTLLEPVGSVDPQTFFTYSGILGLLGLAAVIAYKFQTSKAKKQTKQRIETGTRTQEIDEDWLQGTSADARTAASQKKKSSGKKST
eukprot:TRINITY_DN2097_c0_g1_i3.p1 TRINITY_DN2097_c0_g1~~TRINITY_DN2097_c0_g1_i3.p1  ORF type:complete len:199 (-),score=48.00 TRINITY_DN2097_c0_g1_i3:265-861(-)